MKITTDDNITNLTALRSLTSVSGNLSIDSNAILTSLSGLDGINHVNGALSISSNNALSSLSGLETLNRVSGNLSISSNSTLTSLSGLEALTHVGEFLNTQGNIQANAGFSSLNGLDNINRQGGHLTIYSNIALRSLNGLENITTLEGNLYIGTNSSGDNLGNPNLVNLCGIRQLINNGEITNREYFVGNNNYNPMYLQIQNANTCYSTTASVRDFIEKGESIVIYPNPAKDILHIESEESITFVEIINTLGQVVLKTTESKAIHIGFLPSGVYFVKVTEGTKATLVKILKN